VTATFAPEPLSLRIRYRRVFEEAFMKWLFAGVIVAVATAASAAPQAYPSSAGNLTVETIASGLTNPWSIAFLPDGRLLVTEKPGRMRIVAKDGKLSPARAGCTTSCSTATMRRTARSISVLRNRRAAARTPRSRAQN
jgi:glucose/arabinose dehydrogenase